MIQSRKFHIGQVALSADAIFFLLWAVYGFVTVLLSSELSFMYELDEIKRNFDYTILFFLVLLFFVKQTYEKKTFFIYCLFMLLVFFIELSITNRAFLIYIMFIITAQGLDFEQILKFDIKVKLFTFCTIVGLCLVGVLDNHVGLYYGTTVKSAYGFSHANTFTIYAFIILLEWLLLRYKKMQVWEWCLNALAGFLVYNVGGGRTSSYTFCLLFCLFVIARIWPSIYKRKLVFALFMIITPLMAVFSFVGAYLYSQGNSFMLELNQTFTGRFSFTWQFLSDYGVNLFGHELETIGSRQSQLLGVSSEILDNAYANCLLKYGLVFFILMLIVYGRLFFVFLKNDKPELALFVLFFVLIGIGESYMINPVYNVTLLCLLGVHLQGDTMQVVGSKLLVSRSSFAQLQRQV